MEALRQKYLADAVEASNQHYQLTGVLVAADALAAAVLLARELLRDDESAGEVSPYTLETASQTAADVFEVGGDSVLSLLAGAFADAMVG